MYRAAQKLLMTAALAIVVAGTSFAAPPGAPVEAGFNGTKFRGIALGQSRSEVEAALAAIGRRCLTDADLAKVHGPNGASLPPLNADNYIENRNGYTACRIVKTDFAPDSNYAFSRQIGIMIEQQIGAPMNAVSFVNDVATLIIVEPAFFNAQGTAESFAASIAENYAFERPLEWHGSESGEGRRRGVTLIRVSG